ncbi:MAG TPA: plastocyanin/azurin family copper-binding protein [Nitrososphaeraceae archaeon]|nr:plastocyanin/azurin family copper-binding protein [Nitrososphaeraceae archaeon]
MLSKNEENNKAVLAILVLMLLSLSVASSIAISAPHYASAQGVTGQGGGYATNATMTSTGNATNATMTSTGNATNATATGVSGGNAATSVSIVPGSSSLTDTAFQPNPVQVSVGNTVTWTNNDSQPHTVTSGSNGQPDNKFNSSPNFSPLLNPGQTFSFTFTQAGDYPYFCMLHPNMVGTVNVS